MPDEQTGSEPVPDIPLPGMPDVPQPGGVSLLDLMLRGAWVTIANPGNGSAWSGRIIAMHDDPGVVIEQADGVRICLPQSFTVTEAAEPPQPEPETPEGTYGRVEIPGYRENEGWVTEETRFGQQAAVVRDRDGTELAVVMPGPGSRFVRLAPPAPSLPGAVPPRALPAGAGFVPPALDADGDPWLTEDTEGPF